MLDGVVLYNYAVMNDPMNRFSGVEMTDSYSAREADELLLQLKEMKQKQQFQP